MEDNNYAQQNGHCLTNAHPTVMHNLNVLNVVPHQTVSISPAEDQIAVSHTNEPDCEALAFPKELVTGQFTLTSREKKQLLC